MTRRRSGPATAVIAIVVLLIAAGGAVLWVKGPCWLWKYDKAGEVPARCVMRP